MKNAYKKVTLPLVISALVLSGCGSSNKDSNSNLRQWTPEEAKRVAALWMPAKTKECEAIVTIFQEIQRVLGAVVLATTSGERTTTMVEVDVSTKRAVSLMELINSSTSDISIKVYTGKLKALLPKIAQSSSASTKEALDTLASMKTMIGNPPQSCRNETK